MKSELRDKILQLVEENFRWLGAKDYNDAMAITRRVLIRLLDITEPMKTREDFARGLDTLEDPSPVQRRLILAGIRFLPQIIRATLRRAADAAKKEIPSPTGRPPTDQQLRANIVAYVNQLHLKGLTLELSKKRAAQRFGVSESSVQRSWDDRRNMEEADFRSALKWLESEGN